jgi:probable F420-dependent oxidoreductase
VSFHGEFFTVESASIGPRPAKPLDIWVGGSAPGALRRAGRLADGWLASFLTPVEAGAGRVAIETAAAEAGREIEPDHFGISLAVATGPALAALHEIARQRRPDTDPAALVADGWADARRKIEDYVRAGLTKFVIRPGAAPADPRQFVDEFAREMLPLQT